MAQKNRVSADLNPRNKQKILDCIAEMKSNLGDLLNFNLSVADRMEMLKMGEKNLSFVDKALTYAETHEDLTPPYLDVKEARRDLTLATQLAEIARELAALHQSVEDVLMLSGSEAFSAALMFYTSVKGASRSDVGGSRAIYEDLAKRFPGGRPRKAKTAE